MEEDDDDDDEEVSDEEEADEGDEDEDEDEAVPDGSGPSRVERREFKKKQATSGEKDEAGSGAEDDLLVNPNHVTKKLTISDLSAPRELTRRERWVHIIPSPPFLSPIYPYIYIFNAFFFLI